MVIISHAAKNIVLYEVQICDKKFFVTPTYVGVTGILNGSQDKASSSLH